MKLRPALLALFSSLLLLAASPGQWAVTELAWIGVVPLLLACQGASPRTALRLGLLCGLAYYLGLIYWIIIALGHYGGLPPWLTIPALVGLALYMALYLGLFASLSSWTGWRLPRVWTAPLIWVGLDLIRCRLFTGFPWLDLGYSQYDLPLVNQVADLCGHYGITFLIVMVNAGLADLLSQWFSRPRGDGLSPDPTPWPSGKVSRLILPLLLLLTAMGYSTLRQHTVGEELAKAPTIAIGLIQGNIDQSEKWQLTLQEQTVDTYLDLSARAASAHPLDLMIWPETALPFFPATQPLFQRVTDTVAPGRPALLTGAPHFETDPDSGTIRYFNSAFLITPAPGAANGVDLQRYDKAHLVPFGEYIPLQRFLPEAMPLVQTMGNFTPGQDASPLISQGARLGILVCFESIFPELARVRTTLGANLLVNLTNDAWYGRSSAPFQQVPMAVLRAIENRRGLARAANTGISCLIDPLGRVEVATPIFAKMAVSGRLPLVEARTVFTRFGFLFPHLCLLLLSLLFLYGILRRDRV